MNRRTFLKAAAAVPMVAAVPALATEVATQMADAVALESATTGFASIAPIFFNDRMWFVTTTSTVSYSTTLDYLTWGAA